MSEPQRVSEIIPEVLKDLKSKIEKDDNQERREKNLLKINELIAEASREAQSKV